MHGCLQCDAHRSHSLVPATFSGESGRLFSLSSAWPSWPLLCPKMVRLQAPDWIVRKSLQTQRQVVMGHTCSTSSEKSLGWGLVKRTRSSGLTPATASSSSAKLTLPARRGLYTLLKPCKIGAS